AHGRHLHSAVWTGTEMIVWGGFEGLFGDSVVNTGARYNPSSDSWIVISTNGAPTPRAAHSAVWTGNEMIIWGDSATGGSDLGGRYNPAFDTWIDLTTNNAPTARDGSAVVWTGGEMIIWGGTDYNGY